MLANGLGADGRVGAGADVTSAHGDQAQILRPSGESGSTLYGALAGLLIGPIVAAVVAFYVTKAPVPFVDRASRDAGKLPDPRQAPDPNAGLYGRDGAAGTPPSGPTATTPAPLPGTGTAGADTPSVRRPLRR